MTLRCLYVDLDGTLLGANGSLLHDGDGGVSLLGLRAIEACHRAGVEVVIYSGRKRESCWHASRLLGTRAYIYEAGCGLVIDGEEDPALLGEWAPRDGATTFDLIERSGAPALLLDHFGDQLEYHEPWHRNRDVSHLFRGRVDAFEAGALLAEAGLDTLRLLDNGAIFPPAAMPHVENPRAYHLIPAVASKGFARHPPPPGARAGGGGVHRGRRLARGPRRRAVRRALLAGRQRAGARPDAARGAARAPQHDGRRGQPRRRRL